MIFPLVTDIIPRDMPPGFAAMFILNEPLVLRFAGVTWLIVIHGTVLTGMFHVPLAVTLTVICCALWSGSHVALLSVSTGLAPACVTKIA